MMSGIQSAASALRALVTKQDATASNIANARTPGYKRAIVTYTETAAGVAATVRRDESPGPVTGEPGPDGAPMPVEQSNADPLTDITDSLMTLRHTEAAAAALKTSADMLGSIIDITG